MLPSFLSLDLTQQHESPSNSYPYSYPQEKDCRKMGRMMKSKYLVILGMIGILVFCGDVVVGQCP